MTTERPPAPPRRDALLFAMLLGISLLHCCNKRKVLVSLDEPVRVEWVYERKLHGRGRLGGIDEGASLHVARTPPLEVRTNCWEPSPELRATPAGSELAYRCAPHETWQLLYLAKSRPLGFTLCDSPLGAADEPSFERVAAFEKVAAALVECNQKKSHYVEPSSHEVYEEVLERGGPDALFAVLSATRKLEFTYEQTRRPERAGYADPWEMMMARLPKRLVERLDAELRRDLNAHELEPVHLERALWRAPDTEASLAPVLERHAKQHVAQGSTSLMALVLAKLVVHDSKRAGELACQALSGSRPDADETLAHVTLLSVVAKTERACDAVTSKLQRRPCSVEHDCGDPGARRLCTKADLAPRVDRQLEAARSKWNAPPVLGVEQALLAAAYAQGKLPERVEKAAARRRYAIMDGDRSCLPADGGKSACWCIGGLKDPSSVACAVEPEHSIGKHLANCRVRIDDGARRIDLLPYAFDAAAHAAPSASASAARASPAPTASEH